MKSEMDKYILGILETPTAAIGKGCSYTSLTEQADVKGIIRQRNRDSHKGSYGRIGILAGSKGMAGAAVLNCNAALRSGAGLVKACIPQSIYYIVESMSLETITYAFDEDNPCFEQLKRELVDYADVIATGSGCTNTKSYGKLLEFLLEIFDKPLVIDAEGINRLSPEKLKGHKQEIILTPHYGEMARLLNKDPGYFRENLTGIASAFSAEYNVYLVLKGPRTIIACPDGRCYVNTTGNPGMATAGSGDVLTGIIASLAGQGIEITNALRTAVYLHGLAGDIGSRETGEDSLIASDLVKYIPEAIRRIKG